MGLKLINIMANVSLQMVMFAGIINVCVLISLAYIRLLKRK